MSDPFRTEPSRIIDLSLKIKEEMPVYPGDPLFRREAAACHELDGFCVSAWSIGSHLGTHLDAPYHFFTDGEHLNDFSLDWFCGPAALIDLTGSLTEQSADHKKQSESLSRAGEITSEMLEPYEKIFETEKKILLRTGWSSHWEKEGYYTHFPSITPETAEWIADYPIQLLGLESPSLSSFPHPEDDGIPEETELHSDAEAHRILLGRRPPILLLEGLAALEDLPEKFFLSCLPLSVDRADGSPVRAAAILF